MAEELYKYVALGLWFNCYSIRTKKKHLHKKCLAKMERLFPHLLVVLLACSLLFSSSIAVPSARSLRLLVQGATDIPADASQTTFEDGVMEELINRRMDLENDDYPGSGANGRHTPKPPE